MNNQINLGHFQNKQRPKPIRKTPNILPTPLVCKFVLSKNLLLPFRNCNTKPLIKTSKKDKISAWKAQSRHASITFKFIVSLISL